MSIEGIIRSFAKGIPVGDIDFEKVLPKAVEKHVEKWRKSAYYRDKITEWDIADREYKGSRDAIKEIRGDDGTDTALVTPESGSFARVVDEIRSKFMSAESPPIPKALEHAGITDNDYIEKLRVEFEKHRERQDWRGIKSKISKNLPLYGCYFIAVGYDKNELGDNPEYIDKVEPVSDELDENKGSADLELEPELNTEIVPSGAPVLEPLSPREVSLDLEAKTIEKSRTLIVERWKTRDELYAAFVGDSKGEKRKEIDDAIKSAQSGASKGLYDSLFKRNSKLGEEESPVALWEVFVDPDPVSDFYPDGLHAFVVGKKILSQEDAFWKRGLKPVVGYLMEPDDDGPLGATKTIRVASLQQLLDANLALQAMDARANVPVLFYDDGLIDPALISNDPGQLIPVHGNPAAATHRIPPVSISNALLASSNYMQALIEEITQVYSLKHNFKGKSPRLATELEMLANKTVQAYSEPMRLIHKSDKMVWKLYYNQGLEYGYFPAPPESTPFEIDFEIEIEEIPLPTALRRQRIDSDYAMGLYGQPGSDGAIRRYRAARRKIGDKIDDPIFELNERIIQQLSEAIDAGIPDPFISAFWDLSAIIEGLDLWASDNFEKLTPKPIDNGLQLALKQKRRAAFDAVRERLEILALQKQARQAQKMQALQAIMSPPHSAGAAQMQGPYQASPEDEEQTGVNVAPPAEGV